MTSFAPFSRPSAPPSSVPLTRLHERLDEELDLLPCGVICLDREGRIRRYNLAEARFARLDRAQVVGRHFFTEIAPCTATPEFQGRVEAFRGGAGATDTFQYVFDFRFGAQLVNVDLSRGGHPDEVYLCIRRETFSSPRSEIRDSFFAILQSELAPDESSQGVLRDDQERRLLQLSPEMWTALASVAKKEGFPFRELCDAWGLAWGRRAIIEIETQVMASRDATLRELSMGQAIHVLADHVAGCGWGMLSADFSRAADGCFVTTLTRNAFAEALPRVDGRRAQAADEPLASRPQAGGEPEVTHRPQCHLVAAWQRAAFSHLAARLVTVQEVSCLASGADACRFIVGAEKRQEAIARAIRASGGDVELALNSLREDA